MKKALLFILLLYHFTAFSQYTFKKRYRIANDSDKSYPGNILYKNDTTILYGYAKDYSSLPAYFHFLNDSGNIIQTKLLISKDSSSTYGKAKLTSDGGLIVFSENGNVYRLNDKGNVVWSKKIKSKSFTSWSYNLAGEDEKGNYLIAGLATEPSDQSVVQVIKLNRSNGEILWNTAIANTQKFSTDDWFPVDIAAASNGNIIIGGHRLCGICEVLLPEYIQLDKSGKVLNVFETQPLSRYAYTNHIYRLFSSGDHMYVLAEKEAAGIYLFDVATAGNKNPTGISLAVWSDDYKDFALQKYLLKNKKLLPFQKDNFTVFDKNGALLKYTTTPRNEEIVGTLSKYDTLGRICSRPAKPFDIVTSVIPFYTRKVYSKIITDSVWTLNLTIVSAVVKSVSGVVCEQTNSAITQKSNALAINSADESKLRIYPSIAHSLITLINNSNISQKVNISIQSSDGKVIKTVTQQVTKGANSQQLNVQDLTSGLYFIKLQCEEGFISGKFIKQ